MGQVTLKVTMPPRVDSKGQPLRNRKGEEIGAYTGRMAGLMFTDGVYLTDEEGAALNRGQLEFFRRKGYTIEPEDGGLAEPKPRRKGGGNG